LRNQLRLEDAATTARSGAVFDLKKCVEEGGNGIVQQAPVVVSSCIATAREFNNHYAESSSSSSEVPPFDSVVLDEAGQTTEPALLTALTAVRGQQLVLVGDTKQLPPTVTSMDANVRRVLGRSLMERLKEEEGVAEVGLSVQYRMPQCLLEFPSGYFYGGDVRSAAALMGKEEVGIEVVRERTAPEGFRWPSVDGKPLAFINMGGVVVVVVVVAVVVRWYIPMEVANQIPPRPNW